MAQITSLDKKEQGVELTDSKIKIRLKEAIHPFLLLLSKTKIGYKVQRVNKLSAKILNLDSKRPIIFVCNHTNSHDAPIALGAIRKHTFLLVGKQPLEPVDEVFFNLNGTIWVDRKDKEDMASSKEAIKELLGKHKNILVFPEGTWNTEAPKERGKLLLNMKWGIIEIAQQANALIVPIALDYDFDTKICKYKFGESIDVNGLSKQEGIDTVRDRMATLRWDLFETRQVVERESINITKELQVYENYKKEYPKLNEEYEESIIFHPEPTQDEVFEPIRNLK